MSTVFGNFFNNGVVACRVASEKSDRVRLAKFAGDRGALYPLNRKLEDQIRIVQLGYVFDEWNNARFLSLHRL